MRTNRIYADYNATVPLRCCAKDAMLAAIDCGGNSTSIHTEGRKARKFIETARKQLLSAMGLSGGELIFTSGATEAAQLAMESAKQMGFENVYISSVEHPAIFNYAQLLWPEIKVIPTNSAGECEINWLESEFKTSEATSPLVIIMAANNENGIVNPIGKFAALVKNFGGAILVDAVQGLGKLKPNKFAGMADWLVLSAHKIGGPMGVGALYLAPGIDGATNRPGGGQEKGLRSGTLNTPGIAGFGAAAVYVADNLDTEIDKYAQIRSEFEKALKEAFPEVVIIGENTERLANTSSFYIDGWNNEQILMALDIAGISISAGSACSSGSSKASRIMLALGLEVETAKCVVRVSFGHASEPSDAQAIVEAMVKANKNRQMDAA